MAVPYPECGCLAGRRQGQAAILLVVEEPRLRESLHHRGNACGRDVELLGDVGDAGITLPLDQFVNAFEVAAVIPASSSISPLEIAPALP